MTDAGDRESSIEVWTNFLLVTLCSFLMLSKCLIMCLLKITLLWCWISYYTKY